MSSEVPCKWCGRMTTATSLKECSNCWEIRHRASSVQPEVLRLLLESVGIEAFLHKKPEAS